MSLAFGGALFWTYSRAVFMEVALSAHDSTHLHLDSLFLSFSAAGELKIAASFRISIVNFLDQLSLVMRSHAALWAPCCSLSQGWGKGGLIWWPFLDSASFLGQ